MTRPEKISGPVPEYSKEALEHRVEGLMIVKCVITREGKVQRCRILRPIAYMETVILDAMYQSRFKPVMFEGKPVDVDYTFNIRLSLPSPQKNP